MLHCTVEFNKNSRKGVQLYTLYFTFYNKRSKAATLQFRFAAKTIKMRKRGQTIIYQNGESNTVLSLNKHSQELSVHTIRTTHERLKDRGHRRNINDELQLLDVQQYSDEDDGSTCRKCMVCKQKDVVSKYLLDTDSAADIFDFLVDLENHINTTTSLSPQPRRRYRGEEDEDVVLPRKHRRNVLTIPEDDGTNVSVSDYDDNGFMYKYIAYTTDPMSDAQRIDHNVYEILGIFAEERDVIGFVDKYGPRFDKINKRLVYSEVHNERFSGAPRYAIFYRNNDRPTWYKTEKKAKHFFGQDTKNKILMRINIPVDVENTIASLEDEWGVSANPLRYVDDSPPSD
jgi:hypothetical protein